LIVETFALRGCAAAGIQPKHLWQN
jgi:hypothetical protein